MTLPRSTDPTDTIPSPASTPAPTNTPEAGPLAIPVGTGPVPAAGKPRSPLDRVAATSTPEAGPLAIPVGTVVPYDMALDRELRRFSQDRYGFEQLDMLFTRTPFEPLAVTVEQAREISRPELITSAVQAVSAAAPLGYIYGCTSGSFVRGLAGEHRLVEAIAEAGRQAASAAAFAVDSASAYDSAAPAADCAQPHTAVTTSGALLEAVHALGARRISAATPYDQTVGALFGRFFAEAGVELVHTANLGLSGRIWTVPWETTYELVCRADSSDAEAVLISCTNLPTYEILDQLEQDLGKPVISANQATVWAALRQQGRDYFGPGAALRATTLNEHTLSSESQGAEAS